MTGVVHNWCWIIQQVVAGELTEWSRKREYQSKELMMPIISRRMMLMKVKVTCMMMVELCASLEPGTSKQESQEQSRYLFLIRESGASLVEICVIVITSRASWVLWNFAHSAFAIFQSQLWVQTLWQPHMSTKGHWTFENIFHILYLKVSSVLLALI